MTRIIHISPADKFMPDFINTVQGNFSIEDHLFLVIGDCEKHNVKQNKQTVRLKKDLTSFLKLISKLYGAEKIILHGLYYPVITVLFFLQPWLLKKCYWVIWGGDLYRHKQEGTGLKWKVEEFIHRHVVRRVGHLITYIPGDIELARQWYGSRGDYHECLMYPSNTYKEIELPEVEHDFITLLVGNSADPSNNHFDIFKKLKELDDQSFRVICPLSYSDMGYAKRVAEVGHKLFGRRFTPLLDFVPYQDYLKVLACVDIAIFAHKRQQAMGNTISLLGFGKKVYMRGDVTQNKLFDDVGVKVFDVNDIDLAALDNVTKKRNQENIKSFFAERRLINQYRNIFEEMK